MIDINPMAFKTDLQNVNWNIIITQKQIQNTKHFLKYSLSYTKTLFLKEFSNQSKRSSGTMDKQRVEKIV